MRNEFCIGVFAFPKSIVFCCLLLLLSSQISAQTENESFENAFDLDETQSMDNKKSNAESNKYTGQISPIRKQSLSGQVDVNEDEGNHDDKDETKKGVEEVSFNAVNNSDQKNKPENEITLSDGFSEKIAGRRNRKYARYGRCLDTNRRDHHLFFFYLCKKYEKINQDRMSLKFSENFAVKKSCT